MCLTLRRTVAGRVPKAALADVMRAAGYYPSEADTEALMAHVKFLADMAPADDTAVCSTSGSGSSGGGSGGGFPGAAAQHSPDWVDLDTFLLLYLSHRPVVGFSRQQVEAAFKTLGASTASGTGPMGGQLYVRQPPPCVRCACVAVGNGSDWLPC
jgi:hypothetical protein